MMHSSITGCIVVREPLFFERQKKPPERLVHEMRQNSGDLRDVAPPVPIPNTEVKRAIANDSAGIACVKVGRCQLNGPRQAKARRGSFFWALLPSNGTGGDFSVIFPRSCSKKGRALPAQPELLEQRRGPDAAGACAPPGPSFPSFRPDSGALPGPRKHSSASAGGRLLVRNRTG